MTADAAVPDPALGLLREATTATLGTLLAEGQPCVTLVSIAMEKGKPLFLLSRLALHTRNLARDSRASLLLTRAAPVAPDEDPLTMSRLTLIGGIARMDAPDARPRFLAVHPEAAGYVDFADFDFYAMDIERAHLVAGFGRIVEIAGEDPRAAFR